jgi:hypothetical protein
LDISLNTAVARATPARDTFGPPFTVFLPERTNEDFVAERDTFTLLTTGRTERTEAVLTLAGRAVTTVCLLRELTEAERAMTDVAERRIAALASDSTLRTLFREVLPRGFCCCAAYATIGKTAAIIDIRQICFTNPANFSSLVVSILSFFIALLQELILYNN